MKPAISRRGKGWHPVVLPRAEARRARELRHEMRRAERKAEARRLLRDAAIFVGVALLVGAALCFAFVR